MTNYALAQTDSLIQLREVKVSSSRLTIYNAGLKTMHFDSTLARGDENKSLSDLLNENSAIYLKNYSSGGLSTTSLRGGSSYHTGVLWNGFSIASPMHGLTDLSLEKNLFFDDINIQYGGSSSLWGSGAVSGTIHLDNKPLFNSGLTVKAGATAGSFSDYSQSALVSWSNRKFYSSIRFFNENNKNNFLFKDAYTKKKEEQSNAEAKQYGIMNDYYLLTGNNSILNLRLWYSFADRHLPTAILQVNPKSEQTDISERYSAEWKTSGTHINWAIRSALFKESLSYDDAYLPYSKNKTTTIITEATGELMISPSHRLEFGSNNTYAAADSSENMASESVNRIAFFSLYKYNSKNERIDFSAGVRKEISTLTSAPFIFSGGLNYRPHKCVEIRMAASNVYRNPTLNDLFWVPGGNTDLKPEKGYSMEGGFTLDLLEISRIEHSDSSWQVSAGSTYFYKDIDDWIIWSPASSSLWRPQNLSRVKSYGTETNGHFAFSNKKITVGCDVDLFYTISRKEKTVLANDASLHQQLIYVPMYRWNGRIFIAWNNFGLHFNHSFTGYRYTTSDNSDFLEPFSLDNIQVDKIFNAGSSLIKIFFRINNIFDTSYQSVLSRPMPLRFYQSGISIAFHKK